MVSWAIQESSNKKTPLYSFQVHRKASERDPSNAIHQTIRSAPVGQLKPVK